MAEMTPEALYALGEQLAGAGDDDGALAAYRAAAEPGDPQWSPRAACQAVFILEKRGDPAGAVTLAEQAAASGHPDYAPIAALGAANNLARLGDTARARQFLDQAIDSRHRVARPLALRDLGFMLRHGPFRC